MRDRVHISRTPPGTISGSLVGLRPAGGGVQGCSRSGSRPGEGTKSGPGLRASLLGEERAVPLGEMSSK